MASYDTSVQYEMHRSRRRQGMAGTAILVALGVYFLIGYLREGALQYGIAGSLPLAISFFCFALSILPLSIGFGGREHPVRIEMTSEAFRMIYQDGRNDERKWAEAPIDTARDLRKATAGTKARPGLEVNAWVPVKGMDPQVDAFRPQQLTLSGQAFDEARRRMSAAGCETDSHPWREGRKGTMWKFSPPPRTEESAPKG